MRRSGILSCLALVALCACTTNLNWKTIKSSPAPTRFGVAPDGSVWGFGAAVMHRSTGGVWSNVDVCGRYGQSLYYSGQKQEIDLAFAGGVTWVLCGNTTLEGQTLLRYESGQGQVVNLPNDQDLQLAQLDGDVALLGHQHLYQHVGEGFAAVPSAAPPDYATSAPVAGHAIGDLYAGSFPRIAHWNGAAWLEVTAPVDNGVDGFRLFGAPYYRSGHVYAGMFELAGEAATPVVHDSPGLARGLTAFAVLGPNEAFFIGGASTGSSEVGTNVAYFWRGKSGDSDFTFLGDAPFFSGSLYSAGGQSGFAVDEHTLLVANLSDASHAELEEGVE